MRDNSTISEIVGNSNGTLFLEESCGSLWYVSMTGDVELLASAGVQQVAVGESHAVVLMTNGDVATFFTYSRPGQQPNRHQWRGQFAVGPQPEQVSGLMQTNIRDAVRVACGDNYSMALCDGGLLCASGDNRSGVFGNGTYSQPQTSGFFQVVQRNVLDVTAGCDWCFVTKTDGVTYKAGSNNRNECGERQIGSRREEPSILTPAGISAAVLATGLGRSVAIDSNGDAWHTGYGLDRDNWPDGYHFKRRTKWEIVPELQITKVLVGFNCETMAIDDKGNVLACGTGSTRKFGQWYSGCGHMFSNNMSGEHIALTHQASFVKSGGVWFSSYEKNPHGGLSLREDSEKWSYELMFHPRDWMQVSNLRTLGMSENDAVRAAMALA